MNLPFRRRGQPHGTPRLRSVNDTQADEDAGRWLGFLQTGPADGITWPPARPAVIFEGHDTEPLARYRGEPRYTPDAYPHGHFTGVGAGTTWHPAPVREDGTAAVLPMPQARAVMEIYPPGPGVPAPTPQALRVVRYLCDRVAILRMRGQLDRISDEKLAMLPALSRRTTARVIVDEAAELLRCGGDPR